MHQYAIFLLAEYDYLYVIDFVCVWGYDYH